MNRRQLTQQSDIIREEVIQRGVSPEVVRIIFICAVGSIAIGVVVYLLYFLIDMATHFNSIGARFNYDIAQLQKFFTTVLYVLAVVASIAIALLIFRMVKAFLEWRHTRVMQKLEEREYAADIEKKELENKIVTDRLGLWEVPAASRIISLYERPSPVLELEAQFPQGKQNNKVQVDIPGKAPTFLEMCHLIKDEKIVLGWGARGPIYGTLLDLLSMLLVGKPGRGKSVALLYFIAVLEMTRAKVFCFDPQGSLAELRGIISYYDVLETFCDALPEIRQEIKERDKLWRDGQQTKDYAIVILVDELPMISAYEKENRIQDGLIRTVRKAVLEWRKYKVYVLVAGQAVPATIIPTDVRDNFSSRLIFYSSDRHASIAGLDGETRERLLPLLKTSIPGTAILDVPRLPEPVLVCIPMTTIEDLRTIVASDDIMQSDDSREERRRDSIPTEVRVIEGSITPIMIGTTIHTESTRGILSGDLLRIYNFKRQGMSVRAIATKTGMSKSTVDRHVGKLLEMGYTFHQKRGK